MERPRPTLEQLRHGTPWCWVVCERCLHRTLVTLVPFIICWGSDSSSDMLRRSPRCTKCGRKGAVLQHLSWAGSHVGFEPFPVIPYLPKVFRSFTLWNLRNDLALEANPQR
jgi:hypothetical protein